MLKFATFKKTETFFFGIFSQAFKSSVIGDHSVLTLIIVFRNVVLGNGSLDNRKLIFKWYRLYIRYWTADRSITQMQTRGKFKEFRWRLCFHVNSFKILLRYHYAKHCCSLGITLGRFKQFRCYCRPRQFIYASPIFIMYAYLISNQETLTMGSSQRSQIPFYLSSGNPIALL